MVRLNVYAKVAIALAWLIVTGVLTVLLWIVYRRSVYSYSQQTCFIKDVAVVPSGCAPAMKDVYLNLIPGYQGLDSGVNKTAYPVYLVNCSTSYYANSTAASYKINSTLPCYVDTRDSSNIVLSIAILKLRTFVSAIVPTMLFVTAMFYAAYQCLRPCVVVQYETPYPLNQITYGGHGDTVQPPPRAMESSGNFRGEVSTGQGNESRRLTTTEANKIVAKTTAALADVNLPQEAVCVVCLDEIDAGTLDSTVVVLPCTHAFHPPCITQWLTKGNTLCPCCNFDVSQIAGCEAFPESGRPRRIPWLSVPDRQRMATQTTSLHTVVPSRNPLPVEEFSSVDGARHSGVDTRGTVLVAAPVPTARGISGPDMPPAGGDGEIQRAPHGQFEAQPPETEGLLEGTARTPDSQPL